LPPRASRPSGGGGGDDDDDDDADGGPDAPRRRIAALERKLRVATERSEDALSALEEQMYLQNGGGARGGGAMDAVAAERMARMEEHQQRLTQQMHEAEERDVARRLEGLESTLVAAIERAPPSPPRLPSPRRPSALEAQLENLERQLSDILRVQTAGLPRVLSLPNMGATAIPEPPASPQPRVLTQPPSSPPTRPRAPLPPPLEIAEDADLDLRLAALAHQVDGLRAALHEGEADGGGLGRGPYPDAETDELAFRLASLSDGLNAALDVQRHRAEREAAEREQWQMHMEEQMQERLRLAKSESEATLAEVLKRSCDDEVRSLEQQLRERDVELQQLRARTRQGVMEQVMRRTLM